MTNVINKPQSIAVPIKSVPEARTRFETLVKDKDDKSSNKTESIRELVLLMKVIENSGGTKLEERKNFLNRLSPDEKGQLLSNIRENLLDKDQEIKPNTILSELDKNIEEQMLKTRISKVENSLENKSKFLTKLSEFISSLSELKSKNDIPTIKNTIIILTEKIDIYLSRDSDNNLNELKKAIIFSESIGNDELNSICKEIKILIRNSENTNSENLSNNKSLDENLENIFNNYSHLIGLDLNDALNMCEGNRITVVNFLETLIKAKDGEIMDRLLGSSQENIKQIMMLVINQMNEFSDASAEKKLQVFTANIDFGLKALEAEAKSKGAVASVVKE
jgi:hypothetical protein